MRRLFHQSFFLIFFLATTTLYAQHSFVGLKAAANRSFIEAENDGSMELQTNDSFSGGLVFSSALPGIPAGISVEPGFVVKGFSSGDEVDYKFNYINLPVLLEIRVFDFFKLAGGMEVAYLLNAKNHAESNSANNIKDSYNRHEASYLFGGSISPTYFIDLGFRYHQAITKSATYDASINSKNIYNQYMQLYMIFKILN